MFGTSATSKFAHEKPDFEMYGFVAIKNDVRVDFAGLKVVSDRGMLRLEMRVAGGWGS
jgi:hypothetical protein